MVHSVASHSSQLYDKNTISSQLQKIKYQFSFATVTVKFFSALCTCKSSNVVEKRSLQFNRCHFDTSYRH